VVEPACGRSLLGNVYGGIGGSPANHGLCVVRQPDLDCPFGPPVTVQRQDNRDFGAVTLWIGNLRDIDRAGSDELAPGTLHTLDFG